MSQVHVSTHPLVMHHLAQLRHEATPPSQFRATVKVLTQSLFYEAAQSLPTNEIKVRTPMSECDGRRIAGRVGIFPILRAGLGMADAVIDQYPEAIVYHLGLYRDHETLKPVTYYNKIPLTCEVSRAYVLDPMLATGGSAVAAITILKNAGVKEIGFLGLIAAPEGVAALLQAHPDVNIFVCAVDERLNEIGYIVPGLGDAGDRQFGTS